MCVCVCVCVCVLQVVHMVGGSGSERMRDEWRRTRAMKRTVRPWIMCP